MDVELELSPSILVFESWSVTFSTESVFRDSMEVLGDSLPLGEVDFSEEPNLNLFLNLSMSVR